jgi:hypothetical protein
MAKSKDARKPDAIIRECARKGCHGPIAARAKKRFCSRYCGWYRNYPIGPAAPESDR